MRLSQSWFLYFSSISQYVLIISNMQKHQAFDCQEVLFQEIYQKYLLPYPILEIMSEAIVFGEPKQVKFQHNFSHLVPNPQSNVFISQIRTQIELNLNLSLSYKFSSQSNQNQIYAKQLIMSNPESKQSKESESKDLINRGLQSNPKDSYQQLMEEGKQVIDSINLVNYTEPTILIPRQNEQTIIILNEAPRPTNKPYSHHHPSQEEARQPAMEEDSRKEGNQNMQQLIKKSSKIFGCNCLKSKCTKNYCQCFTQARKCNELCKCTGCQNQGEVEKRYRPNIEIEEGEKFCNCKKSNCLKKYCECYNSGVKCNSNCKCEECKNSDDVANGEPQEMKDQTKRQRSQKQIEEINSKIEELSKLVPKEHQQYLLSFLDYLLS